MKIKVLTPFRFAEDGVTVIHYGKGEHDVSPHVCDVAVQQGWAKKPGINWPGLRKDKI
ncbi:MAG: hypothetical protein ACQEQL_08240 [Pseudomonadota bacterium]